MSTLKEKILSLIGGGCLMSGFGLIKGMTRTLSHDTRFVSKIESINYERHTRDIHAVERSLPAGHVESSVVRAIQPNIIRSTIHNLPKWEEISGGIQPIIVNTTAPQSTQPPTPPRPLYVDLRLWDNPITSQGNEGSCTAYATVAAMENELNQAYQAKIKLSETSLWSMYRKPHINSAIQSATGESTTFVRLQSFNGSRINNGDWIAYINNPAALMSIKKTDEILDLLAAHHPVILTTVVNESFDQGGKGWIEPTGPSTDSGHVVVIVGYKIDTVRPQLSYFIIRNSWGPKWGDQGYGYLPIAYCGKYPCAGFAVKNVRMEKLSDRLKSTSNKNIVKFTTIKMGP